MITLPYTSDLRRDWDQLISDGVNSALVHYRGYLDYHKDRFLDCSVMIYEGDVLLGVFPAEEKEKAIYSHRGITFGDVVFKKKLEKKYLAEIIESISSYYKRSKHTSLEIRSIPAFYWKDQALYYAYQEVLKSKKFIKVQQKTFQTVCLPLMLQDRGRKWGIRKAQSLGLHVNANASLEPFWSEVLSPNLWETYQSRPTHSLEEMQGLMEQFPEAIQCWAVNLQEEIFAGVLTFKHDDVLHLQYTSANAAGKKARALDLLLFELMQACEGKYRYVSLGTSIDPKNQQINPTLTQWKDSWGAVGYETGTWIKQLN